MISRMKPKKFILFGTAIIFIVFISFVNGGEEEEKKADERFNPWAGKMKDFAAKWKPWKNENSTSDGGGPPGHSKFRGPPWKGEGGHPGKGKGKPFAEHPKFKNRKKKMSQQNNTENGQPNVEKEDVIQDSTGNPAELEGNSASGETSSTTPQA